MIQPASQRRSGRSVNRVPPFLIAATYLAAAVLAWLHLTQGPRNQRVDIRWAPAVSDSDRVRAEREMDLVDGVRLEGRTWQYFLRKRSPEDIQRLIGDPRVEDTDRLDHTTLRVRLDRPDLPLRVRDWLESDRLGSISLVLAVVALLLTWRSPSSVVATMVAARRFGATLAVWPFVAASAWEYYGEVSVGGDNWRTADWLIWYMHGPLRRGLSGTLLLGVSNLGLSWKWVVYVAQVSIYAATVLLVVRLYAMRRREAAWLMLLYSPVFLLFTHFAPESAFRKEILAFLPLALLAIGYARQQITRASIVTVSALFVLAAFSHEIAAFMLPFFLGLVYLSWKDTVISTRVAQRLAVFFVFVSMAGIATALLFPIDQATLAELCQSLRDRGFRDSICDGALAWLDKDISYGFVDKHIAVPKYTLFHVAAIAVSLGPLWAVRWWGGARTVLIVGALLWMLPLYAVSIDWGRWVYTYVFGLFTIVFADTVRRSDPVRRVPFALVVLYLISWSIPLCCGYTFGGGFSQQVYDYLRMRAG